MGQLELDDSAAPLVPPRPTLPKLREAAAHCKACPLWKTGTQTVFGEGSPDAQVMFVGEQPGDQEDLEGKPFVGPAGKLFDEALAEAGIDRDETYVTNAVKHFKWKARGKRRIHQKPNWSEIAACHPWLEAEIAVVRPRVLVRRARRLPARRVRDCNGSSLLDPSRRALRARTRVPGLRPRPQTGREATLLEPVVVVARVRRRKPTVAHDERCEGAAGKRHSEQKPRISPGGGQPERGRNSDRAPAENPLLAGRQIVEELTHHPPGRMLATLVIAFRTLLESNVIAPITARVITARTTPYSAIV